MNYNNYTILELYFKKIAFSNVLSSIFPRRFYSMELLTLNTPSIRPLLGNGVLCLIKTFFYIRIFTKGCQFLCKASIQILAYFIFHRDS